MSFSNLYDFRFQNVRPRAIHSIQPLEAAMFKTRRLTSWWGCAERFTQLIEMLCCPDLLDCFILWSYIQQFSVKSKSAICAKRKWRLVHLSPIFWVKEQKRLLRYKITNKAPESHFINYAPFQNLFNHYQEIATQTWSKMNTYMQFVAHRK